MSEIRISTSVYFQSEHVTTGPRLSDSAVLYFCYRRQKFMTKNTCKFFQCISQSKHPQNMLKAHFNDSIWTCWKKCIQCKYTEFTFVIHRNSDYQFYSFLSSETNNNYMKCTIWQPCTCNYWAEIGYSHNWKKIGTLHFLWDGAL